MSSPVQNRQIAAFALNTSYDQLTDADIDQLKRHLLDSIGSLLYATTSPTIGKLVRQLKLIGEGGPCKVPILKNLSVDRAAQLYTALIRYPDFMDNFMGKEATCHPSDNIGSLLAVSQLKPTSGKDFLAAMAVAYEVECRLVLEIPVMKEGIDHTLMLGYSLVCGISRLLGLSEDQTANALGISGTSISPMVTSRASYTSEWKGFASSNDALQTVNICLLAAQGMTGPLTLFEGPKGFGEVFGMKLKYDWRKDHFELIRKCVLKKFNAEVHSQAVLEGIQDILREKPFKAEDVERIDITTFLTAYHIIGGGAYGNRKIVETKEQADHSLFYVAAALIVDGNLYPDQFEPSRIKDPGIQKLLQKVFVHTGFPLHKPVTLAGMLDPYTEQYPDHMRAKIVVRLKSGRTLSVEKKDYHGFFTRPLSWDDVILKFHRLTKGIIPGATQKEIIDMVRTFEQRPVNALIDALV